MIIKKNLMIFVLCALLTFAVVWAFSLQFVSKKDVVYVPSEFSDLVNSTDYSVFMNCSFQFTDSNGQTNITQFGLVTFNESKGYEDFIKESSGNILNCQLTEVKGGDKK